eukprot:CAMPEP_0115602338 /NCGR_PEP_ID=MMETSP0272-20121206/15863_1 /TAXON_ID=71861 /ORGANISM="Scrippsiella trochoidea, Strain CCMP3099" /LENGTH=360 /DNA_ID=CAMNT_0003037831 /DNA_START=23 /DNA_END=1106 /DNA_ORIENTATION=+
MADGVVREVGIGGRDGDGGGAQVRLHVYDLDNFTGRLLNGASSWPRAANCGLFHCGVEVYGWEYCFQYYYDAWETDGLTGVQQHRPRQNDLFQYRESVDLGCTALSRGEVHTTMQELRDAWPSNSYHLISHNCVDFAEEVTGKLRVQPVPRWVAGAGRTAFNATALRGVVNAAWWLVVWAMILTSRELASPEELARNSVGFLVKFSLLLFSSILVARPSAAATSLDVARALRSLRTSAGLALRLEQGLSFAPPLPLGFVLGLAASAVAVMRHWGFVKPICWLERIALLAFSAWAAIRGALVCRTFVPALGATGTAACVVVHRAGDPPQPRGSSWGRASLLLAAQVFAAFAGVQLMLAEQA